MAQQEHHVLLDRTEFIDRITTQGVRRNVAMHMLRELGIYQEQFTNRHNDGERTSKDVIYLEETRGDTIKATPKATVSVHNLFDRMTELHDAGVISKDRLDWYVELTIDVAQENDALAEHMSNHIELELAQSAEHSTRI